MEVCWKYTQIKAVVERVDQLNLDLFLSCFALYVPDIYNLVYRYIFHFSIMFFQFFSFSQLMEMRNA